MRPEWLLSCIADNRTVLFHENNQKINSECGSNIHEYLGHVTAIIDPFLFVHDMAYDGVYDTYDKAFERTYDNVWHGAWQGIL